METKPDRRSSSAFGHLNSKNESRKLSPQEVFAGFLVTAGVAITAILATHPDLWIDFEHLTQGLK